MTVRLRLVAGVVISLLGVAACSSGGDKPAPPPSTTSGGATGSSTTDGTAPTATASATATKVCDLVPKALLHKVLSDPVENLGYGSENYAVCGTLGTVTFEFGYRIVAGGEGVPPADQYTRPAREFGDRAMLHQDAHSATLWVQRDDVTFQVRNDVPGDGSGLVSLDTTKQVMTALITTATPQVVAATEHIALPATCPPADSAVVTAVAGTITAARGNRSGGDAECHYLGSGGTRIDLDRLTQAGAERDFVTAHASDPGTKKVSLAGAHEAYVSTSDPSATSVYWSTDADTAWSLDASALTEFSDYQHHVRRGGPAAAEQLATAFTRLIH
jgi:hypothetical protein